MLKNLTLNVLGDSYTTPDVCVEPSKSFWGLAAKDLDVKEIINYSHTGFSLDHVMHILLNENFDFANDYFLIGVPPLGRHFGYHNESNSKWPAKKFNTEFVSDSVPVHSLDNTSKSTREQLFSKNKEQISEFSFEWLDVQSLKKIFLLHQYLTLHNAKFLILNLTYPVLYQDMWPAGQAIMQKVNKLQECVIFDNTFQSVNLDDQIKPADFDVYGWYGHHGPDGNANWYNKVIKPKMIELNWIDHA